MGVVNVYVLPLPPTTVWTMTMFSSPICSNLICFKETQRVRERDREGERERERERERDITYKIVLVSTLKPCVVSQTGTL